MGHIYITKFGQVDKLVLEGIEELIDRSYQVLGKPMGGSVSINIYERSEAQQFFSTHDALEERPRICVYMDRLREMNESVGIAGIRRQVVHSIIHGSLDYYLVKFPDGMIKLLQRYDLSYDFGNSLLYSIATAAKEYEVTDYLCRHGFDDEQALYAKYILIPMDEEILAWRISKTNRLHKVLYMAALIRDISCAMPFSQKEGVQEEMKILIEKKLSHLDMKSRFRLGNIVYRECELFGADTFTNIDTMAEIIINEILSTELRSNI